MTDTSITLSIFGRQVEMRCAPDDAQLLESAGEYLNQTFSFDRQVQFSNQSLTALLQVAGDYVRLQQTYAADQHRITTLTEKMHAALAAFVACADQVNSNNQ